MDPNIADIEDAVQRLPASERVRLIEVIARSLRQPTSNTQDRKTQLDTLLDELADLPSESPDDGFSNRDHDRLLYGEDR